MTKWELDPDLLDVLNSPWLIDRIALRSDAVLKALIAKPPAPAVFEFNTMGDAEGFAGTYFRDDAGAIIGPPVPVGQFAFAQYQESFPLPKGYSGPQGALTVYADQFDNFAQTYGFPDTSAYWTQDIISPVLTASPAWQKATTVEAWALDDATVGDTSHVSVQLVLWAAVNGYPQEITSPFTGLKRHQWTKVSMTFGANAWTTLRNVVIRVRGDWAKSSLPAPQKPVYGGYILLDHIAAS